MDIDEDEKVRLVFAEEARQRRLSRRAPASQSPGAPGLFVVWSTGIRGAVTNL